METNGKNLMPALFLGHGSPMNAIEDNIYTQGFEEIAKQLPTPKAILCISAHWETIGTFVTAMDKPKTIHDFGGFPKRLFEIEYLAPGSPDLAKLVTKTVTSTKVELDYNWGLDHGCWSVIKFLFPNADIPIVQMSIDYTKPAAYHYQLAKKLTSLRQQGIMLIASGNIVHNLRMINWRHIEDVGFGFDWAQSFNNKITQLIMDGEHERLIHIEENDKNYQLAAPAADHYLPLLYILATQTKNDIPIFFNDSLVGGSLSMTSLLLQS